MPVHPPFHLAFPVHDLDAIRAFYGDLLGCMEGRSADRWVDFDFFGHQISAHLSAEAEAAVSTNSVDGDSSYSPRKETMTRDDFKRRMHSS